MYFYVTFFSQNSVSKMEPLKIIIHENCGASYEVAHTNYAPFSVPPRKPDDCVQQIPPRKSDDYEQQIPPRKSDDCVQQIPPQKSDDCVQQIPPQKSDDYVQQIPPISHHHTESFPPHTSSCSVDSGGTYISDSYHTVLY